MKNTSVTTPGRHDRPPQLGAPVTAVQTHLVRRVGPLDRAALHLGVALIKWGRRPARQDPHRRRALDMETRNARQEADRVLSANQAMNMTRFR
jgi:hypothetical protein